MGIVIGTVAAVGAEVGMAVLAEVAADEAAVAAAAAAGAGAAAEAGGATATTAFMASMESSSVAAAATAAGLPVSELATTGLLSTAGLYAGHTAAAAAAAGLPWMLAGSGAGVVVGSMLGALALIPGAKGQNDIPALFPNMKVLAGSQVPMSTTTEVDLWSPPTTIPEWCMSMFGDQTVIDHWICLMQWGAGAIPGLIGSGFSLAHTVHGVYHGRQGVGALYRDGMYFYNTLKDALKHYPEHPDAKVNVKGIVYSPVEAENGKILYARTDKDRQEDMAGIREGVQSKRHKSVTFEEKHQSTHTETAFAHGKHRPYQGNLPFDNQLTKEQAQALYQKLTKGVIWDKVQEFYDIMKGETVNNTSPYIQRMVISLHAMHTAHNMLHQHGADRRGRKDRKGRAQPNVDIVHKKRSKRK